MAVVAKGIFERKTEWVLILVALALASHPASAGGSGNYPPPASGDWYIYQKTSVWSEKIEMISIQTDSGWNGFDGYIDGLEIQLANGKVGRVNLGATTAGPTAETVNVSGFTLDGNLDAKISGPGTFRSQELTFFNMNGTVSDNSVED